VFAHNSTKERRRSTKISRKVVPATDDIPYQFQDKQVKGQGHQAAYRRDQKSSISSEREGLHVTTSRGRGHIMAAAIQAAQLFCHDGTTNFAHPLYRRQHVGRMPLTYSFTEFYVKYAAGLKDYLLHSLLFVIQLHSVVLQESKNLRDKQLFRAEKYFKAAAARLGPCNARSAGGGEGRIVPSLTYCVRTTKG